MKVGTDGVLLGAFTDFSRAERILDVGAGTGLIALMAAQRNQLAEIVAVEKDKQAFEQMKDNFCRNEIGVGISPVLTDFTEFAAQTLEQFDCIVSNPPYFNSSNPPKGQSRLLARHNASLSYEALILGAVKLMPETGHLSVILPSDHLEQFNRFCLKSKLHLKRFWQVKPTPGKPPKRVMLTYTLTKEILEEKTIVIESGGRHIYSPEYVELTQDFYMNM